MSYHTEGNSLFIKRNVKNVDQEKLSVNPVSTRERLDTLKRFIEVFNAKEKYMGDDISEKTAELDCATYSCSVSAQTSFSYTSSESSDGSTSSDPDNFQEVENPIKMQPVSFKQTIQDKTEIFEPNYKQDFRNDVTVESKRNPSCTFSCIASTDSSDNTSKTFESLFTTDKYESSEPKFDTNVVINKHGSRSSASSIEKSATSSRDTEKISEKTRTASSTSDDRSASEVFKKWLKRMPCIKRPTGSLEEICEECEANRSSDTRAMCVCYNLKDCDNAFEESLLELCLNSHASFDRNADLENQLSEDSKKLLRLLSEKCANLLHFLTEFVYHGFIKNEAQLRDAFETLVDMQRQGSGKVEFRKFCQSWNISEKSN